MRTWKRIQRIWCRLRHGVVANRQGRCVTLDITADENAQLRDSIAALFYRVIDTLGVAITRGEHDEAAQLEREHTQLFRLLRALAFFKGAPPVATTIVMPARDLWGALRLIHEHSQDQLAADSDAIEEIARYSRTLSTAERLRAAAGLARLDLTRGW